MPHAPPLVATIVISLTMACALGFLAHRLKLPPLVGYLVAGIMVGPFTPGFVADSGLASQLAEIGIILLMFGVGLHFSPRDLTRMYSIAVPGAFAQIAVALPAGAALGLWWGWGLGAGLILGLSLSVASTVVLLRVLQDRGALDSDDGQIAVGWLIVQDVAMVLALVLLPTLADRHHEGLSVPVVLLITIGKAALFALVVLLVGRRVVPWLLALAARSGSRELFTLSVLASALGIAFGSAALFDVSFALGAFFAGVVLSESDLSHQAAADSLPLQDAFAVLFFVSVGMLFDPFVLLRDPLKILAALLVVILAKSIAAVAVVLLAGRTLRSAMTVSAGLAQVGEFSFILTALGVSLGVFPVAGRDVVLAVALLSIAINPILLVAAGWLPRWLERRSDFARRLDAREKPRGPLTAPVLVRDHAIVVGHGRVGATITRALGELGLPFVVVERDRRRAEELRDRGIRVIWGDAAAAGVLRAASIRRARVLVVAMPDSFQARRILEVAREARSTARTIVRTHTDAELEYLERQGVAMAVMGERELALTMAGFAMRGLGVPQEKASVIVQGLRNQSRVGSWTDPDDPAAEAQSAPELRPRREGESALDEASQG